MKFDFTDHSKLKSKTVKFKNAEEFYNQKFTTGKVREFMTQEQEFKMLDELEEFFQLQCNKTRDIIKKLDAIHPDRQQNSLLMSWKTPEGFNPFGYISMWEDIVDTMSVYNQDFAKTLITETDEDLYDKVHKRDKTIYNLTKKTLGLDKEFVMNYDQVDDLCSVGELIHFYNDRLVRKDTSNKKEQIEMLKQQYGCLFLAIFDVFGEMEIDYKSSASRIGNIAYETRNKIKENKLLFSNLSNNLQTMH